MLRSHLKNKHTELGGGGVLVAKSCPTLATPWTVVRQALLSVGFSRQECWIELPRPSPGDLLDLGIKPTSPISPVVAGVFFTTSATTAPFYR